LHYVYNFITFSSDDLIKSEFYFFLIPFLCGIFHCYYKKIFKLNYFLIASFLLCIFSTGKYHLRFNEERKFNELEGVDISKAVDAITLNKKLNGLKWITFYNPHNPQEELNNLKEAMNLFKNDLSKKMLITDYQIIAPILDIYDNSPNQWHHPSVSFPSKKSKYYKVYKDYFIDKIKKKKIKFIFETREDTREENRLITSFILDKNCYTKERVGKMLIKLKLNLNCQELK